MKQDGLYQKQNVQFQTIAATARMTGLSQYYLRNGCRDGVVPHIRCGTTYMVNVPLLLDQLNAQSLLQAQVNCHV